jgi:hypothetical protein
MDIYLIICFLRGTDPSLWGGDSPSVTQKTHKKKTGLKHPNFFAAGVQ